MTFRSRARSVTALNFLNIGARDDHRRRLAHARRRRLGGGVAAHRPQLANLSPHLDAAILAAAPTGSGWALDIGCGAGETSAALAAARPDLRITGVDLSPNLLAVARERWSGATFLTADVGGDDLPAAFDLLFSRHGVMFFADSVAAFTRLHAAARPGAVLVFTCFRNRSANAFASELVADVLGTVPFEQSGYAPGPFAFADSALVGDVLRDAGWTEARPEQVDFAYISGGGVKPIADAADYLSRIGPLASAMAASDDRDQLLTRLKTALERYRINGQVVLPASAWLWRARAGERA